ncbi:hypothetical protein caldi_23810 [Caldinitratiruptor microaerophilus]|uniref:Uncharacterized protein n=1 Tax=Caldinitratiruptor microaerophilus TaxID=671077 RepID=A0AA35G6G9_9FIRM|nr:hypothetical protein caldi_23810 [Caldinitratiruptor microaerophilus]
MWGDLHRRPSPATGTSPVHLISRRAQVRSPANLSAGASPEVASIRPQIIPARWGANWLGARRTVPTHPLAPGLCVALVVDAAHGYRFVTQGVLERWGKRFQELLPTAVENLARSTPRIPWKRLGHGPRLRMVCESFDGYDASRLLLREQIQALRQEVEGRLVVAVPGRDFLVALGDADRSVVEDVAQMVREVYRATRYRISPRLFTLAGDELVPYALVPNKSRLQH